METIDIEKIHSLQVEHLGSNKPINKITPLVSVFVTTYQHAKYVSECLESILMQKINFPVEIVVGEDQSTDGTREICIEYAKKYPEKIRLFLRDRKQTTLYDENGMFSKSINGVFTLMSCRGKRIAVCEGDDYWTDRYKLQKQVDFLEANADHGLIHTDADCFFEASRKYTRNYLSNSFSIPEGDVYGELLVRNFIATVTVMFRSEFIKNVDINELSRFKMGDKFLWLEIARRSKVGFLNESTAVYRVRSDSVSHALDKSKRTEFFSSSFNMSYHFIDKYGCGRETEEKVYRQAFDTGYSLNALAVIKDSYDRLKKNKMTHWNDRLKFFIAHLQLFYYIKRIAGKLSQLAKK
jgi:glycosyltransferase involved in cell wall biosynthesis